MPIWDIDTPTEPFSTFSYTMDGVEYLVRLQYNERAQCYYLSLGDPASGIDLVSGIKVVTNFPLLKWYRGGDIAGLPPGELLAFSNTPDDSDADIGELGLNARVVLVYMDQQFVTTGT
jgi:hypothetical protein